MSHVCLLAFAPCSNISAMTSNPSNHGYGSDHGSDHIPLHANSRRRRNSRLSAASGPKTGKSQLGVDFQPSDVSVICGRGEANYNHEGNRWFRRHASMIVERYSRADSKAAKSALVLNVVTMIRQAGGHFCKYERGTWYEVGDRCARAKVSAFFRNRRQSETPLKQDYQQLDEGTGRHSEDDSSISSSDWDLNFQGFDSLPEEDLFDMNVF
jgi:hypothetical protein